MKLEIVTVSNRAPSEPYYIFKEFKESVRRFGDGMLTILGQGEPWGGLMTKPRRLRHWLRTKQNRSENLIVCDAWDVVFNEHPHGTFDKYEERFGRALLFNAERNCFPRGDLAPQFPDPGTPWRYLNSGLLIGHAPEILALLESMNIDDIPDDHRRPDGSWFNPNDQEHYTLTYLKQPVPMVLDTGCYLCQSFSGCSPSEFHLASRPIKNLVTGTEPRILHFNGDAKNYIMPRILSMMDLVNL